MYSGLYDNSSDHSHIYSPQQSPFSLMSPATLLSPFLGSGASNPGTAPELSRSKSPTIAKSTLTSRESHSAFLNSNLYIKLLNSSNDCDAVIKQIQGAGPDAVHAIVNFLTSRCKKLQTVLQSMQYIASESEIEKSIKALMICAIQAVDAKYACLYTITDGVVTSSITGWRNKSDEVITENLIYGGPTVFKGEIVNSYNVKTSEWYTDEIHKIYGELDPVCILSAPIMLDTSKVTNIIEFVNKSTPGANPYFTAEDEFLIKGLSSMWTILLNQSLVRQQALRKSDDIRVLLNTASLMSSELDLGGKKNNMVVKVNSKKHKS